MRHAIAVAVTESALEIDSHKIRRDGDMWCLTDLWRAAGSPKERRPYHFLTGVGRAFVEFLNASADAGNSPIVRAPKRPRPSQGEPRKEMALWSSSPALTDARQGAYGGAIEQRGSTLSRERKRGAPDLNSGARATPAANLARTIHNSPATSSRAACGRHRRVEIFSSRAIDVAPTAPARRWLQTRLRVALDLAAHTRRANASTWRLCAARLPPTAGFFIRCRNAESSATPGSGRGCEGRAAGRAGRATARIHALLGHRRFSLEGGAR